MPRNVTEFCGSEPLSCKSDLDCGSDAVCCNSALCKRMMCSKKGISISDSVRNLSVFFFV